MKQSLSQVDHPEHYSGGTIRCLCCDEPIECIDVIEELPFNIGNAIKYLWRLDRKHEGDIDLDKAIWYLKREQERRQRTRKRASKLATMPKGEGTAV